MPLMYWKAAVRSLTALSEVRRVLYLKLPGYVLFVFWLFSFCIFAHQWPHTEDEVGDENFKATHSSICGCKEKLQWYIHMS